MRARFGFGDRELVADLSRPLVIAIEQDFSAAQPRHFGAPKANTAPYAVPGFSGSVSTGSSCNCNMISLIPHCNGTHTECVGHLTVEAVHAHATVPNGLIPALLLSVQPVTARDTSESTEPAPEAADMLVTQASLAAAWPAAAPIDPQALIIRTLPNDVSKTRRDYTNLTAPYFSREAARLLTARGIEHLIVDLPSIDRSHDEGFLTAHRVFFGLPRRSRFVREAQRPAATITELAFVPDAVADGFYLLQIQVPALGGDAVPSRPLLYALESQ